MNPDFSGRTAIVTGAGKGIGRSCALCLAARGARVVVNNHRHPGEESGGSADRVAEEIRRAGGIAIADHGDALDPLVGTRTVEAALAAFDRLDILIANAGVGEAKLFRKQDFSEFRRVIETNFFGAAAVAHAAFPYMHQASYGRMLLMTSSAGLYGALGIPAYSSSKAAMIGLMRSLSLEGARSGILVNAIAPYAATRMTLSQLRPGLQAALDPDLVAPVAAWLVSERATVTGDVIITGGGRVRRARMMESPSGDASRLAEWCTMFDDTSGYQTRESATEQFADFAAGLGLEVE